MGTEGHSRRWRLAPAALVLAVAVLLGLLAGPASAYEFEVPGAKLGLPSFSAEGINEDGSASTAAGGRPWKLDNSFSVATVNPGAPINPGFPAGDIKDVSVELPPGIVGNAAAYPRCTQAQMDAQVCPEDAQIGIAYIPIRGFGGEQVYQRPVFNMDPPPGMPAQFAFRVLVSIARINFHVRTGSDYGVTATVYNINETAPVFGQTFEVWGVPGDPSHDPERYDGGVEMPSPYPKPAPYVPFLNNPTSCSSTVVSTLTANSWQEPGTFASGPAALAPGMTGCADLEFEPTIEAKPTTNLAESPSGLAFHLHIPQAMSADKPATAHLRDVRVALPPTLNVNPAAANGLAACTPKQIGLLANGNEKQVLHYDPKRSASFTVSFKGQATGPIPAAADAGQVQAALRALPGLDGVTVEGGAGGWIVEFGGSAAGTDVPSLSGTVNLDAVQKLDVTAEGGSYSLGFGGAHTGLKFKASFTGGEQLLSITESSRELHVGEAVTGPGIAPGSTVLAAFGTVAFLNQPTTATETEAELETALSFEASAAMVQEALREIPALAGNVSVFAAGTSGSTRSYEVVFGGSLAGTDPPALTSESALTGTGAGVAVIPQPLASAPLTDTTMTEAGYPHFTEAPSECPDAAKLGTVRIDTPNVLDHPLEGNVYLASQNDNPFNSLLAMYLTVNDPKTGLFIKIPARIEADPQTGALTTVISRAPQLPYEDVHLDFLKGAGAPLKTGIACGTYEVATDLVPWSSPEAPTMHPSDSFRIEKGAGGGTCVGSEGQAPATPTFEAGTYDPTAGAYSPFTLKLSRGDGTQQFRSIDASLPKGLIAKLAGVPYCSDAALAAAAAHSGHAEQADPSCPAASKIGSVTVGAGAGPAPFYASGSAYLAGPYKGAPLSLAVVTPAVAGPFDLGTVVVRNAIYVDPETTQVHVVSDPFPSILRGIPLDLRSVFVNLDRGAFTRNPSSCAAGAIRGTATMLTGKSTALENRFQVGECNRLKFAPKLSLRLKGGTTRSAHPALRAVLQARDGEADLAAAAVTLPPSEFLENAHIKTICTRVQFSAEICPPGSIYGKARVFTPLLDKPLEGNVYLRSSAHKLPDLVADLHGQIHVVLDGRIDSIHHGIRATFEAIPDAPVSKFVLEMQGGKKGLLVNNQNLCKSVNRANVLLDGQNGKTADSNPVVANGCTSRPKPKGKKNAKAKKHADRSGR